MDVRLARDEDRAAMHALRHEVFVVGQGVPVDLERDERDAVSEHAVALADGRVVGCGRLIPHGDGTASIGRMAVAPELRGQRIGGRVLALLERRAEELGVRAIELHAQVTARQFYERAGYVAVGDVYQEAGIAHVTMRKSLPLVREVRDDDSEALIELIGGCWGEYPGVELHVDLEEPWLRAPASSYRRSNGRMWVVEVDGRVVACCGVKPAGDAGVELKSMYVAAAARRRGLARRLERLVVAEAQQRGAERIELWSDTRFHDAHVTYRALGYQQLPGERALNDVSNSREFPFVKRLSEAGRGAPRP